MNPRPSRSTLLRTLIRVAARELTWTIPRVHEELRDWRACARKIPHPSLRRHALETLRKEWMNAEGASLFAVIPKARDRNLLRALVAYQVALDYLDTLTEEPSADELEHGHQLHRALVEALNPTIPMSDYFAVRPGEDDGGYLRALVLACRESCSALPRYALVQATVLRAARGLSVQVLNHLDDAAARDDALRAWASRTQSTVTGIAWFEATGAASSTLGIYALLAAATDPALKPDAVATIDAAYHPWICLLCTLMDSLVDQGEDDEAGTHSYVAYYEGPGAAEARICTLTERAMGEVGQLPQAAHHSIVVSGMIAMYLSKEDRRGGCVPRGAARRIRRSAGWLVLVEVPVTRAMRLAPRAMRRTSRVRRALRRP